MILFVTILEFKTLEKSDSVLMLQIF